MKKNPYQTLKENAYNYVYSILNPVVREMWTYPQNTLATDKWNLYDLAQRVQAAQQIGFEVKLTWIPNKGLSVCYVEKAPPIPYWLY